MKQGSFKIFCLIVWACITVFSGFAQFGAGSAAIESAVNYETIILETFNGDDDARYIWKTQASRFSSIVRDSSGNAVQDSNGNSQRYPVTTFVEAWPMAAFGNNRSGDALRSYGLNGQFDRRGYNWIDVYPVLADDSEETPYEIAIPGRVQSIDMWVWGANLQFYIEVYMRDYRGVIHTLRLGDINYPGWKNLRVAVPSNIPQVRRILPSFAGLSFVKFRIWTQPPERVDNFYVYFKQFRILTNTYMGLYDGNDLADPDNVERLWSGN